MRDRATDKQGITHDLAHATTLRGLTACGIIGDWEGRACTGLMSREIIRFKPELETTCMACVAALAAP